MAVTEDMLTAHPELKGIFAANEAGRHRRGPSPRRGGQSGVT